MTRKLAQGNGNGIDGDVTRGAEMPLVGEVFPTLIRAIHDDLLVPIVVLQFRLLAVQAHFVRAVIPSFVAELRALGVLLAVPLEPVGHDVAPLPWALEFRCVVTGRKEGNVLFEPVAVVVVFAEGAVHVATGAVAP